MLLCSLYLPPILPVAPSRTEYDFSDRLRGITSLQVHFQITNVSLGEETKNIR
jgi:hypothetical protein